MNPVALILNADKVYPEPLTLELDGQEPLELAELHSRLTRLGQIIGELKRIVGEDLAQKLNGQALRYGDVLYRGKNGRGSHLIDKQVEPLWWEDVIEGLKRTSKPEALLGALYPASSVRLTALPTLANVLGVEDRELRDKYIGYAESPSPLQVMPISRAPAYLQKLEDGEIK